MSYDGVPGGEASRNRRRTALLAVGVLLPLPLLAGCSDSGSGPEGASQDIAPAARDVVRDGGTLHWAIDAVPPTLNTFQADADAAGDRIAGAVLPVLFTLDEHGRPQRNDDYLAAADVVEREPKQVVRYRIDKSAKWSDGRPIDVTDFRAQWKALSGKDRAYWTARNAGYDRIQKIARGRDSREVRVTFAKPYTDWQSLFTPLYPKSVMGNAAAFNDGARKTLAATAGPFQLKSKNSHAVTLVRNPKWWGDRARLRKLVFDVVPLQERAAALAAGKVDIAEVDRSTAEKIAKEKKPDDRPRGYVLRKSLAPAYTQLALNGSSGPLTDERVRQAIARSIDRQSIADSVLGPLDLPAKPLGSHVLMAGQQGYKDSSSTLGRQDTKAAQALLASAGWREAGNTLAGQKSGEKGSKGEKGGGKAKPAEAPVRRKDDKPLALRFVLPTGSGTEPLQAVGERISRMLMKIGIRTEIIKVADSSYFRDHIASGDYDLALWSWPVSAYPATDARPIFAKPQPAPDGSLVIGQNYTRVGTDRIDQLFDQAVSELDSSASQALVRRADARIWAAAGSIPLYQRPRLVAARKNLANAGAFGFVTPRYQDIGFRK
jgi:peptide/nickel transport system substrate-binding protein